MEFFLLHFETFEEAEVFNAQGRKITPPWSSAWVQHTRGTEEQVNKALTEAPDTDPTHWLVLHGDAIEVQPPPPAKVFYAPVPKG